MRMVFGICIYLYVPIILANNVMPSCIRQCREKLEQSIISEYFSLNGLNLFERVSSDDVLKIFGETMILKNSKKLYSPVEICYLSTEDTSALYFKGMVTKDGNEIYKFRMVRDYKTDPIVSSVYQNCSKSRLVSNVLKTDGGLSLSIKKRDLIKRLCNLIVFDKNNSTFLFRKEGEFPMQGVRPKKINSIYYVDSIVYDAEIKVKFTNNVVEYLSFYVSLEGGVLEKKQK